MKNLLALLFLAALHAQTPADVVYSVDGLVLDANTNTPIRGAVIKIRNNSPEPWNVQSDAFGAFRIVNIKPTQFGITVTAPGYVDHKLKTNTYSEPLPKESAAIKVTLYLQREAAFEGHVLDESGKPISGTVSLYRPHSVDGRMIRVSMSGATLTASGQFRIPAIMPGDYWVYIFPDKPSPSRKETFSSMSYPDPTGVRTLHFSSGKTEKLELRLRSEKGYTIKGKVIAKVSPLQVRLYKDGPNALFEAMSLAKCDKAGAFTLSDLPAGSYTVEAATGATNEGYIARKKVMIGPSAPLVDVTLESPPVRELTARFTVESGEPAPPNCCGIMLQGPAWSIFWERDGGMLRWKSANAGSYRAQFNTINYTLLSARQGKIDAHTEEILVPATGPVTPIEITLGPKPPEIRLQTTNSYPVWLDIARVTPKGLEILPAGHFLAVPQDFTVNGVVAVPRTYTLPPGEYFFFAKLNSLNWSLPLDDPQFFEKYKSYATHITILKGQDQTVVVTKTITPEIFNQP